MGISFLSQLIAAWRLWRADLGSAAGQIAYLRQIATVENLPNLISASNRRWSTSWYERSEFMNFEAEWELGVILAQIGETAPDRLIQNQDGMSCELAARIVLASNDVPIMEALAPRVFAGLQRGGSRESYPSNGYIEDGELHPTADYWQLFGGALARIRRLTGRPWYPSPQRLFESIVAPQASGELAMRVHLAKQFLDEYANCFPSNWTSATIRDFCRGWSGYLCRLADRPPNGSIDTHRQMVREFAGLLDTWAEGAATNSHVPPQGRPAELPVPGTSGV